MNTIVIVGANLAGGRAAEALRKEGFDGRILLVGAEPERPYERPPLSKGFLTGEVGDDDFFLQSTDAYEEQGIELRLGVRATGLNADAKTVTLDTGEQLQWDKLLIATGATPRKLDVEGADLDGIHYLRTVADARAIRDELRQAERVAVIGMGFIGAEVAATARTLGKEAVAIEATDLPLAPLGREVSERLTGIHRQHGVDVRMSTLVTGFLGFDRVERVITDAGGVDCDLAVVGIGVIPETGWLDGSGIEIERGVLVDEHCRTNVTDVYAAGDVARWHSPRYSRRLLMEHFDNAGEQGVVAAKNMLGKDAVHDPVPYFWSDQYDLSIQVIGLIDGYDQVIFRGTAEEGSWSAFYLREGTFQAAVSVNRFKDFSAARRMLRGNVPVTPTQLADESVELRSLLR